MKKLEELQSDKYMEIQEVKNRVSVQIKESGDNDVDWDYVIDELLGTSEFVCRKVKIRKG